MPIERVIPLAKQLLALPMGDTRQDLWLWEHSERVMHLVQMLAGLPEVGSKPANPDSLAVAALFHDAGWVLECQEGRCERWQLLTRPTNDLQRELGAAMLLEEAGPLLPGPVAHLAADAIRHCNDRKTNLLEARLLAEAEALDEVGVTYVLRQFRQYQAEGRPLQQLADTWRRQQEYHYWDVRLNHSFRYETTRELARQRLAAVDAFMTALDRDLRGDDVRARVPGATAAAPESA